MIDQHLVLTTTYRARAIATFSIASSLGLLMAGAMTTDARLEPWLYAGSCLSTITGVLASSISRTHQAVGEDYADLSDQVRTNKVYANLTQSDIDRDLTGATYRWIIMSLGKGQTKDTILATLHPNRMEAQRIWAQIESKYGKLPSGEV